MIKSGNGADYHPGPFGKIPARASLFGVLFAATFVVLGWIGLPEYRWYWIASGMGGALVGIGLYLWHRFNLTKDELSLRSPRPTR
jgi:hypothetical protein